MSIVLGDNIEYKGKKPLDSRMLFDTIADMKAYSENYLPDITLAFNKEDGKMYVFNRENEVDTTTGKWREFEGGATPEVIPEVSTAAELTTYLESLTDTDYHKVNLTAVISFPATSLNVRLESSVYAVQRMNDNNIFAFKNEKIYKFNKANNARTVSEVTNEYMKSDVYELEMDTAYTVEDFFDEVSISARNHSDVIYVDQYGTGTLTTTDGTEIAGEFHMILDAGNDNGIRGGKIYQFNEDGEYVNQFNVMVDVAEGTINVIKNGTLVDLKDTNITNPTDGDGIIYDEDTDKFVNKPIFTKKMKGEFVVGNIFATGNQSSAGISLNRGIELKSGDIITRNGTFQFGVYRDSSTQQEIDDRDYQLLTGGYVTTYTIPADGTYYFTFANTPTSTKFTKLSYSIEDLLNLEDYSAFYEEVLTTPSPRKGKVVTFLGDSITRGTGTTEGERYCDYLNNMIGFRKCNVNGLGGSCVSVTGNNGILAFTERYQDIRYSDLIVIFGGTNDRSNNAPLGNISDNLGNPKVDTSYITAWRIMLGDLQQKFPAARIVVVPPLHRKLLHGVQVTDDNFNDLGYTLQDYVDATKLVAEEYSCPVLDLWSTMGITPRVNMTDYFPDGLHPNAIGHMLMARVMEKALNNLNFDGTDTREHFQKIQMPTAKELELGKIYQYTGTTNANYTNGFFYKCVVGQTAGTYKWQNIDVQAEADSSNVSYRGMTVEQALDIANPLVENLVNEDTEMVNGFWQKDGQGNPEFNEATSGGLSDFVSFYIPVTEGETLYISSTMNNLWCAYLDENKQPLYVGQFNGPTVTIPTGQNIAYFSYPTRYAYLPIVSVTRSPAQYNGSVDVYMIAGSGETKMDYPTAGRNNNTYATNMYVETTPTEWRADYTYDFDNNVFGIGTGFYVLGVNTVDKTAIALSMDTKIYIFDIGLNTFVEGTYEVPNEWKKNLSERKSPSRFCGCTRADDENNYILRSEGLSDLIIPKSAVKTFVESNSKVFNNYTSASGMVYAYGNAAYKYKSIYSVRHKGPLVEKKVEVEADNHWANKTWYAYGTSMTDASMNGYTVELQSLLGANLTNYGKGGSGIIPSLHGGTSGDNTYTRVKRTSDGKTNADLITLEIIPNDMSGTLGTPTDNYADGTTETFCGCLNELLQYLQVNTNAQIVVLIATRSRYNYQDPTEKYPPESQKATDWLAWTDAAKECCRRNCVPFIDGQSNCGLGYARVKDGTKYVRDQIHLTPLGAKNLGQYFYSQIKNIPLFYSE